MGHSDATFEFCNSIGLPNVFKSILISDDILVQLVVMELTVDFAKHLSGLRYLFDSEIITWLINCFSEEGSDTSNPLLATQALRELGNILSIATELHLGLPWEGMSSETSSSFLRGVRMYLAHEDAAFRLAGIKSLASFAASGVDALQQVLTDSSLIEDWLSNLSSTNEMQAICLHSIAKVLSSHVHLHEILSSRDDMTTVKRNISDLYKSLLVQVGAVKRTSASSYLIKVAKNPVNESRHAAFDVMRAIASQDESWGLQMLYNNPDFRPFIEDRTTEFSKEGKVFKDKKKI
jgi:hypothetical protein